jgi:signal peptidase I
MWKPNKWTGAALSLFGAQFGLGLFYVGAPRLAIASVLFYLASGGLLLQKSWHGAYLIGIVAFMLLTVMLTYWLAARRPASSVRGWYSKSYGLVGIVAVFVLTMLLLRSFFFEPFRLPSASMAPGFPKGSSIMVQKWGYGHYGTFGVSLISRPVSSPLARGDVIVFDYPKDPSQSYIKRLVGLPGDQIVIQDHRLTINGIQVARRALEDFLVEDELRYDKRFEETLGTAKYHILHRAEAFAYPYLEGAVLRAGCSVDDQLLRCTIPADHYFVMGDNRDNSQDSRMFGFVPGKFIIGKVIWSSPTAGDSQ